MTNDEKVTLELTERMNVLAENVGHALGIMSKQIDDLTQKVESLSETVDLQPTCNQLATDCISRQAAIEWCLEGLNNMPSAERPRGEWIFKTVFPNDKSEFPMGYLVCSVCGSHHSNSMPCNYCDNCGAQMKGADDE